SIKNDVSKTIWHYWHRFFARKRFQKDYAYNVLGFRRRYGRDYKHKTTIAYKRGFTKAGYLSPIIKKGNIEFKIPNYTKAKEWKMPGGIWDRVKTASKEKALEIVTEFVIAHFMIADIKKARRIARLLIREKQTTIKPAHKFRAEKSVFEELSYIPDHEIQYACNKLNKYRLRS
ncbi:MAG: hypothetical protein QXS54_09095, partial [Candidatus Methanomethylicaceae archaeon]